MNDFNVTPPLSFGGHFNETLKTKNCKKNIWQKQRKWSFMTIIYKLQKFQFLNTMNLNFKVNEIFL